MDEQMIISLFISIFVPLSFMLILFDKKTRKNFLFIIIGTYMCVLCGSINGYIKEKTNEDLFYLATTVTPVIEEFIKALPILFYAFFITDGKKRVVTASSALGLGFALLENIFVISSQGTAPSIGWALARSFGAGLMHCSCGVIVGYGMIYIRKSRKFFISNIFAMLTVAIIYHGIFNALSGTGVFLLGPLLSLVVFVSLIFIYIKEKAKKEKEDTENEKISVINYGKNS